MRELIYTRTFVTGSYPTLSEALAEVVVFEVERGARQLTFVSIEVDIDDEGLYYVTFSVEGPGVGGQ